MVGYQKHYLKQFHPNLAAKAGLEVWFKGRLGETVGSLWGVINGIVATSCYSHSPLAAIVLIHRIVKEVMQRSREEKAFFSGKL